VDVYTKVGFRLSLNRALWSFGDVVWKNTEIWVTDVKNHDWCDNYNVTQSVKPLSSENQAPLPNITVTHGYSAARVYQQMIVCLLDEIRMVQPSVDAYMPGEGQNNLSSSGTPNPYY